MSKIRLKPLDAFAEALKALRKTKQRRNKKSYPYQKAEGGRVNLRSGGLAIKGRGCEIR